MPAVKPRMRPIDTAIVRLTALATKGVQPHRMVRAVEVIASEWLTLPEADPSDAKGRLDELREQIAAGVADAEEQLAEIERSEDAALRQAQSTLAAPVDTRDAAQRALASL